MGEDLVTELLNADQSNDAGIKAQRERVAILKQRLAKVNDPLARQLFDSGGCAGEEERLDHRRRRLGL